MTIDKHEEDRRLPVLRSLGPIAFWIFLCFGFSIRGLDPRGLWHAELRATRAGLPGWLLFDPSLELNDGHGLQGLNVIGTHALIQTSTCMSRST